MSATDTETLAENFAAQGREELLTRFRDAYTRALGVQSDLVSFDADHIETMVQRAVADADGLQWRRALAGVAARELGIELGSALTHPAVARAHQLVAAPSYESALAALAVPAPIPETPPTPAPPPAVAAATPGPEAVPAGAEPEVEVPATEPERVEESEEEVAPALEAPSETEVAPEAQVAAGAEAEVVAEAEVLAEVASDPGLGSSADAPDGTEVGEEQAVADAELAAVVPDMAPEPATESSLEPESAPEDPEPEPGLEPAPEPGLERDGTAEAADQPPADIDQPTMTYDAVGATAPDAFTDEDEDDYEYEASPAAEAVNPSPTLTQPVVDDVLSHRAADFAEEFMTESLAAATPAPTDDDFTFEQDAVEVPAGGDGTAEFGAVHLGGVASLPSSEEIAVRLSQEGLDLLQPDGTIVGRLNWSEIAALEVTVPHGRRRRRGSPRLVVHTAGGSARFEVPSLSGEELQEQVQPIMERYSA